MSAAVSFKDPIYRIKVGETRGTDAIRAYVEDGMATLKDEPIHLMEFGGDQSIPNRSVVWGRRIKPGKEDEKTVVAVTDPQYFGDIEFLKYGADGGYPITIRYMESSPSLDYDYQITRLAMPKYSTDEAKEFDYMTLRMGVEEFDTRVNKNLATFLKVTHMNIDSPCKMPSATGACLKEVVILDGSTSKAKETDARFEAGSIVRKADTFEQLTVLIEVINRNNELSYDKSDQNSMFDALKICAEERPELIIESLRVYKQSVSEVLEKSKAFDVLDVSKGGTVVVGNAAMGKDIVLDNVPNKPKNDQLIAYMMENCLSPDVYNALKKIEIINAKL